MNEIIVVANQKGGVAKPSVRNLSYSLAELGKKVLTVDLDPKSNLSIGFGITPKKAKHTTGTLITRMLTEEELPEGADASFFLCKELEKGYLDGITGEGYLVAEIEAEEFDKAFPQK